MVIKELIKETTIDRQNLPKHVALSVEGCKETALKKNIPPEEMNKTKFFNLKNIIRTCTKMGIPLFTFYILPSKLKDETELAEVVDGLADFFNELNNWEYLETNQIKVSVLGKWYDLPGRLVDPIKKVLDSTKDYDRFFLNLCINYDGQEEIVDAMRLIARRVKAGKIDPDNISKSVIKENIYSSYFLPPDLLIKTGISKKLDGFLLWDSVNAKIYFSDRPWPDFSKLDFLKALEFFQK